MTREIRKELNQATGLYKNGKRDEAFEIYDRHFDENPDELKHWDRIRYGWCIYYLHIKDSFDENELVEYAEKLTDLVEQEDMNRAPVCVYTRVVFRLLKFYKNAGDWDCVLYWLDKLNPEFLSETQGKSGDITYPSKKEEYYSLKSKALLECGEFEECIEVSNIALDTLDDFALNGDIWHKFRMAKSLRQIEQPQEALKYLEEVVNVYDYWYVFKEFAEDYCMLEDSENALEYAKKAILANGPVKMKVNVYYLAFRLLKNSDFDFALKHAELFVAIKLENGTDVPEDIEELDIDEENLDIEELENEVKSLWSDADGISAKSQSSIKHREPDYFNDSYEYCVEEIDENARADGYYAPSYGGFNEPFDSLDGDSYY